MDRYENNVIIYKEQLGPEKFSDWLIDKIYKGEKSYYPFSFSLNDDFEDIFIYIYRCLSDREKRDIRYALSTAAGYWDISAHGIIPMLKLYEMANSIGAIGVFIVSIKQMIEWRPKEKDYLGIIEMGKILNEVLIFTKKDKSIYPPDASYYDLLKSYKNMFLNDNDSKFKYIYSPLFRLACKADYNDWPKLGSILATRYPIMPDDFWPIEFASYKNYSGDSGYYDIRKTISDMFKDMQRMPNYNVDEIMRGCFSLITEYRSFGGKEFLGELYAGGIVEFYENKMSDYSPEWMFNSGRWAKEKSALSMKHNISEDDYGYLVKNRISKINIKSTINAMEKCSIEGLLESCNK